MKHGSTQYFLEGYGRLAREYHRVNRMGFYTAQERAKQDILLAALNSAEGWEDVRDCTRFMIS